LKRIDVLVARITTQRQAIEFSNEIQSIRAALDEASRFTFRALLSWFPGASAARLGREA
jgi:hypothetical protein